jgi:Holliday junction resolvase
VKQSRRGDQREVDVGKVLGDRGWVVGSRRHIAGPGDLLAVTYHDVLLAEVKTTARGPFEHFRPDDREALVDLAETIGATPCLAHWPPRGVLTWYRPTADLPSATWPVWSPGPISSSSNGSTPPPGQVGLRELTGAVVDMTR